MAGASTGVRPDSPDNQRTRRSLCVLVRNNLRPSRHSFLAAGASLTASQCPVLSRESGKSVDMVFTPGVDSGPRGSPGSPGLSRIRPQFGPAQRTRSVPGRGGVRGPLLGEVARAGPSGRILGTIPGGSRGCPSVSRKRAGCAHSGVHFRQQAASGSPPATAALDGSLLGLRVSNRSLSGESHLSCARHSRIPRQGDPVPGRKRAVQSLVTTKGVFSDRRRRTR